MSFKHICVLPSEDYCFMHDCMHCSVKLDQISQIFPAFHNNDCIMTVVICPLKNVIPSSCTVPSQELYKHFKKLLTVSLCNLSQTPTFIALCNRSAKKAGVFLRHLTAKRNRGTVLQK